MLVKNEADNLLESEKKKHRRGVEKILHIMRFSRPETVNATRDLSKFMTCVSNKAHMKAIPEEMKFVVSTPQRGWKMKPNVSSDGNPEFEFVIEDYVDYGHATDPDSRKNMSGYTVFLCGIPLSVKSGQ